MHACILGMYFSFFYRDGVDKLIVVMECMTYLVRYKVPGFKGHLPTSTGGSSMSL